MLCVPLVLLFVFLSWESPSDIHQFFEELDDNDVLDWMDKYKLESRILEIEDETHCQVFTGNFPDACTCRPRLKYLHTKENTVEKPRATISQQKALLEDHPFIRGFDAYIAARISAIQHSLGLFGSVGM